MSPNDDEFRAEKGVSLARGPALILGTVLLIGGLYFLYRLHTFPKLSQFPSGKATVEGKAFLGIFGVNGWSGELTAAAGGALLLGAAQHVLAKTMSLIVGIVLAGVAVIALVNGHSALGLFAANIWTIILWGGSAVFLLVNTLLPRAGGHAPTAGEPSGHRPIRTVAPAPAEPTAATPTRVKATPVRTDTSTAIPERGAVRVTPRGATPDDGSVRPDDGSSS